MVYKKESYRVPKKELKLGEEYFLSFTMPTVSIFLFRNDLRIEDNPAFYEASINSDFLIPVTILDTSESIPNELGFPKMGRYRKNFLLDCLHSLDSQLKNKGSSLFVLQGNPLEILNQLKDMQCAEKVYMSREYTTEETEFQEKISDLFPVSVIEGNTLYLEKDLPFIVGNTPAHFTPFREKLEKKSRVRKIFGIPEIPPLPKNLSLISELDSITRDSLTPIFRGGIESAIQRVNYYFFETGFISSYKKTRNEIQGIDFSSKFSPYLARGCISARQIYESLKKYESEVEKNESTYWLYFELLWRDYFKWVALQKGRKLFFKNGWSGKEHSFSFSPEIFNSWRYGTTEEPLINAFMRELYHTGFMSNRGRQIVASFFTKELGLDWRRGAEWFESCLIDYDASSNYGNWAYQAGVGNDPRSDRTFNLQIQRESYDPDGTFISRWCGRDTDIST